MLTALLFASSQALAIDADQDGWHAEGALPDCDDDNEAVNPAAAEDVSNRVDDDCDGSRLVRRVYVTALENPGAVDRTLSNASFQAGQLNLTPPPQQTSVATLAHTFAWGTGELNGGLDVDTRGPGASCTVEVKKQGAAQSTSLSLEEGTNSLKFSDLTPGSTVGLLRINCSGGSAIIDWLTVANGPYSMAPLMDMEAEASPMKMPSGGRMTFVRPSDEGNYLFMGSDVGGLSYSTNGETWSFANGASQDWTDRGDHGVFDAWYTESGALSQVVVATGDNLDGGGGGLWVGWPDGEDWAEILVSEELGFTKFYSGCYPDIAHDMFSSGKILVHDPADEWDSVYALAQRREVTGKDGDGNPIIGTDTHGVYRVTGASLVGTPAICEPYAVGATSLPELALPTAAAIVSDEFGEQSWLLVGYAVRNYSIDHTIDGARSGLYLCPLVSDTGVCDGSVDCIELNDGDGLEEELLDVRDIEVNPMAPNQVFIVDGGKRGDGTDDGACTTHEHSTVYGMTITANPGVGDPLVEIWDTDATDTTNRPSWSVVPGYASSYGYTPGDPLEYSHPGTTDLDAALRGCTAASSADWIGDLVPPTNGDESGESLTSVAIDPDANFMFTFYQLGDGSQNLGCVRHFRAHLDGAEAVPSETVLDWHPLLDYADRDDNFNVEYPAYGVTGGTLDRTAMVDPGDSFLADEPVKYVDAGLMHDAVFWDNGNLLYPVRLLLAAQWAWWIPPTGKSMTLNGVTLPATGWDAEYGVDDLDKVAFVMGNQPARSFQDTVVKNLSVLSAAVVEGDYHRDLVYVSPGDVYLHTAHGHEDPASREAADRDCHPTSTSVSQGPVATWASGEQEENGDSIHETWWAPVNVATADWHDATNQYNMLYHRRDEGDWCWDAVAVSGRGNWILYNPTATTWDLYCLDTAQVVPANGTWATCNAEAADDPLDFHLGDVGRITDLVALGDDVALLAAAGRCGDTDGDTETYDNSDEICAENSGEGLWVVYDDGPTGLRYEEVTYDEVVPSMPSSLGDNTCDKVNFFEAVLDDDGTPSDPSDDYIVRGVARLSLHPDTDTATGGTHVRAFVSTKTCGVREVEFELGTESSPSGWVAWPASNCPLYPLAFPMAGYEASDITPAVTAGAVVTPDGSSLLVFGGSSNGTTSQGGGVCVIALSDGSAQTAIPANTIRQAISAVVPHPDVEGLYAVAAYRDGETSTTGEAGVYIIQRRALPWSGGGPAYGWRRLSGDDLDHPRGLDLGWGIGRDPWFWPEGVEPPPSDHLYLATAGGGPWDLAVSW